MWVHPANLIFLNLQQLMKVTFFFWYSRYSSIAYPFDKTAVQLHSSQMFAECMVTWVLGVKSLGVLLAGFPVKLRNLQCWSLRWQYPMFFYVPIAKDTERNLSTLWQLSFHWPRARPNLFLGIRSYPCGSPAGKCGFSAGIEVRGKAEHSATLCHDRNRI